MKFILSILLLIGVASAQVPSPQIPLTGNIGAGGVFPVFNNGTLVFAYDTDHTMVYPEMSALFIKVTSSVPLTATRNLIAPLAIGFSFTIENMTTGGQSIQVIASTGTGVTIPNGGIVTVSCDGVNYVASVAGVTSFNSRSGAVTLSAADVNGVGGITNNTSGTSANLSGTPALPNGTTATTQAPGDNTTKLATDAFVLANASSGITLQTSGTPNTSQSLLNFTVTANTGVALTNPSGGIENAAGVVMGASGSSHAQGMVPDPGATAGTTRFLREDATWDTVSSGLDQLTGDVIAGPGTGSQAATVVGINGGTVPTNTPVIGTNNLGQPVNGLPLISNELLYGQGMTSEGDSITCGTGSSNAYTNGYAWLLRPQIGGYWTNQCQPGDQLIDIMAQFNGATTNPTADGTTPVVILEPVTNDISATNYGTNTNGQTTWQKMYQGAIYNAGIATQYKSYPAVSLSAPVCVWGTTGTWASANTQSTFFNDYDSTTNGSTATCTISGATSGQVVVLDYPIWNANGGTFTVALNGTLVTDPIVGSGTTFDASGDSGTTITSAGTPHSSFAHAALRMVLAAGTNTIKVSVTSSTSASNIVGIGFVAVVPPTSPTNPVVVAVGPNHRGDNSGYEALVPTYAGFISSLVSQAHTDGVNVFFADIADTFLDTNVPVNLYVAATGTSYTASNWVSDQGVTYAGSGIALTKVATTPTVGQYEVSGSGVYTFNVADSAVPVFINKTINCGATVSVVVANCISGGGGIHPNADGHAIYDTVIRDAIPSVNVTGNNIPQTTVPVRTYNSSGLTPEKMWSPNPYNLGTPANGGLTPGILWFCNVQYCGWTSGQATAITTTFPDYGSSSPSWVLQSYSTQGIPNSAVTYNKLMTWTGNGVLTINGVVTNSGGQWNHVNPASQGYEHGISSAYGTPFVGLAESFVASNTYYGQGRAGILMEGYGTGVGTGTGNINGELAVGGSSETYCGIASKIALLDTTAASGSTTGCVPLLTFDSTHKATFLYAVNVPEININGSTGLAHSIGWGFGDAATSPPLTTSEVGYITVPFACTITGWHIMANTGTVTIKTARIATGGTALPTITSNSISTSGVSLSTGTLINSTTLTDFTSTTINAGDTLGFFITAVSSAAQVTFSLDCAQ